MFNANLDASGPSRKTVAQLRKELKKWEEAEAAEKAKKAKPNNLDLNTYVVSRLLLHVSSTGTDRVIR